VGESGQLRPAVQEATGRVQAAIGRVLAQAKNEGVVAGDVTVEEFFVLVRGVGQAVATLPAAPVTLDRAIEIICRGLAPARPPDLLKAGRRSSARPLPIAVRTRS
jgi:hypothetical protein